MDLASFLLQWLAYIVQVIVDDAGQGIAQVVLVLTGDLYFALQLLSNAFASASADLAPFGPGAPIVAAFVLVLAAAMGGYVVLVLLRWAWDALMVSIEEA
jgi:hypothetical protein